MENNYKLVLGELISCKFTMLLFLLIFNSIQSNAQTMRIPPQSNVLNNTYLIKTGSGQGTAFIAGYKGEEYLITARHLFSGTTKTGQDVLIYLRRPSGYIPYVMKVNFHSDNYDIAVLFSEDMPSIGFNYELGGSYVMGHQAYFLGFPYTEDFNTLVDGWNIPLIKSSTISGSPVINGLPALVLDGHNNPGFSGGPVIAYDHSKERNTIIGVISGYYPQYNPIIVSRTESPSFKSSENSGLIFAVQIEKAIDIIESF